MMENEAISEAETEGLGTRRGLSEWNAKGYRSYHDMIFKERVTMYLHSLYFSAQRGFEFEEELQQIALIEDALRKIKAAAKRARRWR